MKKRMCLMSAHALYNIATARWPKWQNELHAVYGALDGVLGFANRLLDLALGFLCSTFGAHTVITSGRANALLYLASNFIGCASDFIGCATHDVSP
jgi:hypothetical protein